jgi:NAD(P)-dependent dehydrogenase (short-subunit alcohol dehydrogenase family)
VRTAASRTDGSASRAAVAIVTGGAGRSGRDIASGLGGWGWPVVVVYLEDQLRAEATVAVILAAGGRTVAVRADLADELDVQRLFAESTAAFGGVDVVAHVTTGDAGALYECAAREVRHGGVIVSAAPMAPAVAQRLRERGITVGRAPPEAVLGFLDGWRRAVG